MQRMGMQQGNPKQWIAINFPDEVRDAGRRISGSIRNEDSYAKRQRSLRGIIFYNPNFLPSSFMTGVDPKRVRLTCGP
jgi:hypothetical protein